MHEQTLTTATSHYFATQRVLDALQDESREFYYRVLHSLNHSLQKAVFNTRHSSRFSPSQFTQLCWLEDPRLTFK